MTDYFRPTKLVVDLKQIQKNIQAYCSKLKDAEFLAVIKADAYGAGVNQVLKAAIDVGVKHFGVALIEEGIELRKTFKEIPILMMGTWVLGSFKYIQKYNLTALIYSHETLKEAGDFSKENKAQVNVHLKVDTGMNRIGFRLDELDNILEKLKEYPFLNIDGVMSHFASINHNSNQFSYIQEERFSSAVKKVKKFYKPRFVHISNTGAVPNFVSKTNNLARVGIGMYGIEEGSLEIKGLTDEVLTWKSAITHLHTVKKSETISYGRSFTAKKEMLVATIPVGYADGYSRSLSNKAHILIRGKRASLLGRVCMDMIMVDVTDIPKVSLNDEVVLLGKQENEEISAKLMAEWTGSIPYEIFCAISKRVPREYIN